MRFQDYRAHVQQSLGYRFWEIVWWPWIKLSDYRFNRMMRQWDKDRFK